MAVIPINSLLLVAETLCESFDDPRNDDLPEDARAVSRALQWADDLEATARCLRVRVEAHMAAKREEAS